MLTSTQKAKLRAKALHAVLSIVQTNDPVLAIPFILGVGPEIIAHIVEAKTHLPRHETDALFLIDCMKFLESSIVLAEAEHRIRILTLMIPSFVSLLYEGNAAPLVLVRDFALASILKVGPAYAEEFKRIMGAAPQVKAALEAAIRAKSARESASQSAGRSAAVAPTVPTIQLKMDFSAFK